MNRYAENFLTNKPLTMINFQTLVKCFLFVFSIAFTAEINAQSVQKVVSVETDVFNGSSIEAEKYILLLPGFMVDGKSNIDRFYTYSIDTSNIDTSACMKGQKKTLTFLQGDSVEIVSREAGTGIYNWRGPDNFTATGKQVKISAETIGESLYFVFNSRHCVSNQDTFMVLIEKKEISKPKEPEEFVIFNAVSPNGDGRNDVFEIQGIEMFPNNNVQIFNRWGNRIFSENKYDNLNVVFDGKNFPSGSYYYILDKGNGEILLKGYISLQR